MAPEIVHGKVYDSKVDLWALGVLTYCLLSGGKFPFDGRTIHQINYKIRVVAPDYSFVSQYQNHESLQNFMELCLSKNPA